MAIDERSRHRLFTRLEKVLGRPEADTLMQHLPPVGWADVATKSYVDLRVTASESRLETAMQEIKSELLQAIYSANLKTVYTMMGFFVALGGLLLAAVKLI